MLMLPVDMFVPIRGKTDDLPSARFHVSFPMRDAEL
jgi:hypothetical protein